MKAIVVEDITYYVRFDSVLDNSEFQKFGYSFNMLN